VYKRAGVQGHVRTLRWAWLRTMPAADHIRDVRLARFSAIQAPAAAPSRCGVLLLCRLAAYSSDCAAGKRTCSATAS